LTIYLGYANVVANRGKEKEKAGGVRPRRIDKVWGSGPSGRRIASTIKESCTGDEIGSVSRIAGVKLPRITPGGAAGREKSVPKCNKTVCMSLERPVFLDLIGSIFKGGGSGGVRKKMRGRREG